MLKMILNLKNGVLIIIVLAILGVGSYASYRKVSSFIQIRSSEIEEAQKLKEAEDKLALLNEQKANKPAVENKTDKVIFESPEPGIGAEASFAPLFEMFIDTAKLSGIRIRSIDYNYAPADDVFIVAKVSNYNVCELEVKAVGSYRNFQTFFKTINKSPYVMSLAQMEFKPWENDRSILVSTFKLRLYTKSI